MTTKEKLTQNQALQLKYHEANLKWRDLNKDGDMVHYIENSEVKLGDFERVFGFNFQVKKVKQETDLELTLIKTSEPGVYVKHVVDGRNKQVGVHMETMLVYLGYRSPKMETWEAQFVS